MITMEKYQLIISHYKQGKKIREIARILNISRNTVRRYIDSCQEFCVWLTSFLPNLKLKSCNISYSKKISVNLRCSQAVDS